MHKTREEWKAFNPYFQGSIRSTAAPVVIEMQDDIEELFAENERLRAALSAPAVAAGDGESPR